MVSSLRACTEHQTELVRPGASYNDLGDGIHTSPACGVREHRRPRSLLFLPIQRDVARDCLPPRPLSEHRP